MWDHTEAEHLMFISLSTLHNCLHNTSRVWKHIRFHSKHKIRTFVVGWICRNLGAFWEDQTDPKFVCGGPNSILRTGPRTSLALGAESLWFCELLLVFTVSLPIKYPVFRTPRMEPAKYYFFAPFHTYLALFSLSYGLFGPFCDRAVSNSKEEWSVPSGYPNPTRYPVFLSIPDLTRFSFVNHRVEGKKLLNLPF